MNTVQHGVRDDLDDLAVVVAAATHLGELEVADASPPLDDALGEPQRRSVARIRGAPLSCQGELPVGEVKPLSQRGVGGEAVVAAVGLGHGERDLLAQPRAEPPSRQGSGEAEDSLERGGRLRDHAVEVRGGAEALLHAGQQVSDLAHGVGWVDGGIRDMTSPLAMSPPGGDGFTRDLQWAPWRNNG